MKTFFITIAFISVALSGFAQDYLKKLKDAASANDTAAQIKILRSWEQVSPKDPELFIGYFNYYARISMQETVSIDAKQKDDHSFVLTDTASGKPVAFLNSSVKYNSRLLQKGFDYIEQGISIYPNRLDMRFGKIYMLGQAENYPEFAKEIVKTIDYGSSINHAWLWKEGKPLDDAKNFFLSSLQDYIVTIYNTEDDKLLPLMRQISEAVLKYDPTHVESLSNVALTYLITGEYDKALPYLLKAEKVAPKDIVVLNNIAEAYKRKGDKVHAKAYYEKIILHGSAEEAEDAREKIKELH